MPQVNQSYNLQVTNPTLSKEWHQTKNGSLTPKDVTPNSGKKVWWICKQGHEWYALINNRNRGSGCPYCSGNAVCDDNCLATINPQLAKEWHPTKNGNLTPKDVTPATHKKVWWICKQGHEWYALINNRNRGSGCPYCSGQTVCDDNCLATINPQLAKEWHPTKNGNLTPKDVTPSTHKKVWWICEREHEWPAAVSHRNNGRGCPYCSGKAVCDDNCLATINPQLAKEWHPTKNGNLTPKDVAPNSNKKVWWICEKGHEWPAAASTRNHGHGCPYCSGKAVCDDNCLATINPQLAKEWHPTKNDKLTPKDVTPNSNKKVWWICEKGHEWKVTVSGRNRVSGCPYCSGRFATEENNLQKANPELSKEWHPIKNGKLTPKDVTPFSDKKVWWFCKRDHEWIASVGQRNIGSGCPYCISATSQLELRVFTELKCLFKAVVHRKKIKGYECDIYIPRYKLGVEIDGFYWHKDNYDKDLEKSEFFNDQGITLIRLREKGLRIIASDNILFSKYKDNDFDLIIKILAIIIKKVEVSDDLKLRIAEYKKNGIVANDDEYVKLLYMLPSPFPGNSLKDINKVLADEWHPTKNGNLTPKDVAPNSNKKVWWICEKGHEWKAAVSTRNRGSGCPYCSGKAVCDDNCLATINPQLSEEWHPTKNDKLTPKDVTPGSNKKVWWICKMEHEWKATVYHRNRGQGCPYCSGRRK